MRRILFSWKGFNIYSYPAMLYLGLLTGVFTGARVAQLSGLSPNRFAVATVILVIPAMIGSRLLFVLTHWYVYLREVQRIWRRSEGGLAMYGGLIATVPISVPLLRAMHLPFGAFWDAATFTILVGMTFTRIGCLLNGCCGGRPTTAWYGLNLADHRGVWRRRVPTQIIEMLLAMGLLGVAIVMRDREPFTGAVFVLAIIVYSAVRYIVGRLREDSAVRVGGEKQTFRPASFSQ
jgi:phosphatidylglycerol---prolipoprotein diacylglyceryl transferase